MTSRARTSSAPISSHPLFPAGIAVWFAALFGMGSLALRAQTLEAAVRALQIDLVVPAAAPPLGFTARLLVALLVALAGAVVGFVLARLVAARARHGHVRPIRVKPAKAVKAKRPAGKRGRHAADPDLAAEDNDDLARLDAAREAAPVRRRGPGGLMAADPGPTNADDPLGPPFGVPSILTMGELQAVAPLAVAPPAAVLPTEAGAADSRAEPARAEPVAPKSMAPESMAAESIAAERAETVATDPAGAASVAPADAPAPSDALLIGPDNPATPYGVSPFGPKTLAAALDAAAPEPAPSGSPAVNASRADPDDIPVAAPTAMPDPSTRRLVPRAGNAAQLLRDAPLESLGVVELVERFALALAAREAREAAPDISSVAPPAMLPAVAPTATPDVTPGETPPVAATAVPAKAPAAIARIPAQPEPPAPFAPPVRSAPVRPFDMPAMLRSPLPGGNVEWFDGDAGDESLASLLPPRMPTEPKLAELPRDAAPALRELAHHDFHEPAGDDEVLDHTLEDDTLEDEALEEEATLADHTADRFSSLLDMKPSVRPRAVDPVAGPAPLRLSGGEPPLPDEPAAGDPAETEDALRHALAALQRMSGAA